MTTVFVGATRSRLDDSLAMRSDNVTLYERLSVFTCTDVAHSRSGDRPESARSLGKSSMVLSIIGIVLGTLIIVAIIIYYVVVVAVVVTSASQSNSEVRANR